MQQILELLANEQIHSQVENSWDLISRQFMEADASLPTHFMERRELSFHPYVKLLGYLTIGTKDLDGAIVEIGVWKGKSLALMALLADSPVEVIGIDPCALPGQKEELSYFHQTLFSSCHLVTRYSQEAIASVLQMSRTFRLLHIDGDHREESVFMDFLIYERFVVEGGYLVFDDYGDALYSPQVRGAVDKLRKLGLFSDYDIIGQVRDFQNSFVLRRKKI